MKRGDLFLVRKGSKNDPKKRRVYLVVSRQMIVDSKFSSVICAPVYTRGEGYKSQVEVGVEHGLKHDSVVCCDELNSFHKSMLTDYISTLPPAKMEEVNEALRFALATG